VNGALRQLKQLGAIDMVEGTKLNNLGCQMAAFPLDPRFSKILLSAKDYGCLYVQLYIKNVRCIMAFIIIFTGFFKINKY
jgi:ATP-dependent RNA helicase DHX33